MNNAIQIVSSPGTLLEKELAEYYRLKAGAENYRKAHPRLDGLLALLTETHDVAMQITVSPALVASASSRPELGEAPE